MLKFLLVITLLFSQVHTYCVYNKFTDGTSFQIHQDRAGAGPGKAFIKYMEEGDKRCCNYQVRDCSRNQRNDDEARFQLFLYLANGERPHPVFGKCTTGGAFVVHGTSEDYHYECIDANGISTLARFQDANFYGNKVDPV